jgi:hypothetical protein
LTHLDQRTKPRLSFRLPLQPPRLLRARERIRDYLTEQRVDAHAIDDVVLAMEEAMTNAVRHSGAECDLEVELRLEGDDLIMRVRDHGKGFAVHTVDYACVPEPLATGAARRSPEGRPSAPRHTSRQRSPGRRPRAEPAGRRWRFPPPKRRPVRRASVTPSVYRTSASPQASSSVVTGYSWSSASMAADHGSAG